MDNGLTISFLINYLTTQISETIRPPLVDYQHERIFKVDSKIQDCMETMSHQSIDRKLFLDPSLREELSKSVTLSIPHFPESYPNEYSENAIKNKPTLIPPSSSHNLSSTLSTCLSPTNTSNTLDQSFYLSQFDDNPRFLVAEIPKRDTGLRSERMCMS